MRRFSIFFLFLLTGIFYSCDEELNTTSNEVFLAFWEDMDRYYSHFPVKNIDWDSVRVQSLISLDQDASESNLKRVFNGIIQELQDGHVSVSTPQESLNFLISNPRLSDSLIPEEAIVIDSGLYYIINDRVVYIRIESFAAPTASFVGLRQALEELFQDAEYSVILDIRDNRGGSESKAFEIAALFNSQPSVFRYIQWRDSGDRINGFSEKTASRTRSSMDLRFNTIHVITNGNCVSACEGFILYMRANPQVTTLGLRTAGSTGNPVRRELPNGWILRLSTWLISDQNGDFIEGVGIRPDVDVAEINQLAYPDIVNLLD